MAQVPATASPPEAAAPQLAAAPPPAAAASQLAAAASQLAAAVEVCRALERACAERRRLDLARQPREGEAIGSIVAALGGYAGRWGTLPLLVNEQALLLGEEAVYEGDPGPENLASVMFDGGLRALFMHPGCPEEEVESLVDHLARPEGPIEMEHDLVTALWERDLHFIGYQVADPFLDGGAAREGSIEALRQAALRRLGSLKASATGAGDPRAAAMRLVGPRKYGSATLGLTREEFERGERTADSLSSVTVDYAETLLEIAAAIPVTAAGDVVIGALASAVSVLLDQGSVGGAISVLERLRELEAQRWCPAGSTGWVATGGVTAEHVRRLLLDALSGPGGRSREAQQLLGLVRSHVIPALLQTLIDTDDRATRRLVLKMLGQEDTVPWPDLQPLLVDQRWYVIRNAVQLAGAAGHEELAEHAPRLLDHSDVRVRREVVQALTRLSGRSRCPALHQALSDAHPSVRILAADALGGSGDPEQKRALLAHIEGDGFMSLSPQEMETFLGAYAQLAQETAVAMLDRAWRKTIFSSRPIGYRVAAVLALGRVHTAAATAALRAAANCDDPPIKRAATEALSHRSGGPVRTGR